MLVQIVLFFRAYIHICTLYCKSHRFSIIYIYIYMCYSLKILKHDEVGKISHYFFLRLFRLESSSGLDSTLKQGIRTYAPACVN